MVLKIVALGFREYSRDVMNLIDASIACVSIIEAIILFTTSEQKSASFTVFRTLRILRVFKLSRRMKTFNIILNRITASLKDILTFCVLMFVFEMIFIILGMQFFANTVYIDDNDNLTTSDKGLPPDLNF